MLLPIALMLALATAPAKPAARVDSMLTRLSAIAPGVDRSVLALALQARRCAVVRGVAMPSPRMAVIDYSRPSTQPRLWVFDLDHSRLLYSEYVAHGRDSGENLAHAFSNRDGSAQSSLGLFATAETYVGHNGYSLRMDGLEPGINDNARDRSIVMHGASYVDPLQALRQGRLGRSLGCPALQPSVAHAVIDSLKQGQMLFAYFPDRHWLASSRLLDCGDRTASLGSESAIGQVAAFQSQAR